MRALLVLLLLATTARADDIPTLRVSTTSWSVKLERVAVAIHGAPETTWVTLSLTGREQTSRVSIDVPSGTRVFGLGVATQHASAWGRPQPAYDAHPGGGAALSWQRADDTHDHLVLAVNIPSTIDIAMQLPPLAQLAIESDAGKFIVEVDGTRVDHTAIDLSDVPGVVGPARDLHVAERVALVASPTQPSAFFEPAVHTFNPRVSRDIDKAIIRRYVKRHRPQLRQCYMAVAQWNPTVKGGATLSFMITPQGTVEWARASESDLPAAVTACLVEEVLRWEFPESDGSVQVNYPFEFRLAE